MSKYPKIPTQSRIRRLFDSDAVFACGLILALFAFMALAEFICWAAGVADPSLTIYK